jgi:hypothetical protein
MKKQTFTGLVAGGLAAVTLGVGLLANPYLEAATGRYPGSVPVAVEKVEFFSEDGSAISRQGVYQTEDQQSTVRAWYAQRFQISPAADNYTSGDCVWLSRARHLARLRYATSVLLCSQPRGTRIVVNETIGRWP